MVEKVQKVAIKADDIVMFGYDFERLCFVHEERP
jgi:hypothetical protein